MDFKKVCSNQSFLLLPHPQPLLLLIILPLFFLLFLLLTQLYLLFLLLFLLLHHLLLLFRVPCLWAEIGDHELPIISAISYFSEPDVAYISICRPVSIFSILHCLTCTRCLFYHVCYENDDQNVFVQNLKIKLEHLQNKFARTKTIPATLSCFLAVLEVTYMSGCYRR